MESKYVTKIIDDSTMTAEAKVTALKATIDTIMVYLRKMRKSSANEVQKLDLLMAANGNNPDEHHAKTMVFYGRSLVIRDLFNGVSDSSVSHQEPLKVDPFTGLDTIISEYSSGDVVINWDCVYNANNDDHEGFSMYKPNAAPKVRHHMEKHMWGSGVQMPDPKDFVYNTQNNSGMKLLPGTKITGWKHIVDPIWKTIYLFDDLGNTIKEQMVGGTPQPVIDKRVFNYIGASTTGFKLPFDPELMKDNVHDDAHKRTRGDGDTGYYPRVYFVLNVVNEWFTVELLYPEGSCVIADPDASVVARGIKTVNGASIILPTLTAIQIDPNWEAVMHDGKFVWSTIDISQANPTYQKDPDGDDIKHGIIAPDRTGGYVSGTPYTVGGDGTFYSGIRKLWLALTPRGRDIPTPESS